MDWDWTGVAAVVTALIGAGGIGALATKAFDYLLARRKLNRQAQREDRQAESEDDERQDDQNVRIINMLQRRVKFLEGRDQQCQEKVAELERKVGRLETLAEKELLKARAVASVIAGADGLIREVTADISAVLHWTPQQLLGQSVEKIVPPRLRSAHRRGFSIAIQQSKVDSTVSRDTYALDVYGQEVPVTITLTTWRSPIPDGPGESKAEQLFCAAIKRREVVS